jgi:hypothetical protein
MDENDFEAIVPVVPKVFLKLAAYYHQEPEILASLLLMDFCQHPPKNLIIVEPASDDADENAGNHNRFDRGIGL